MMAVDMVRVVSKRGSKRSSFRWLMSDVDLCACRRFASLCSKAKHVYFTSFAAWGCMGGEATIRGRKENLVDCCGL
jgi:hypothetical protein